MTTKHSPKQLPLIHPDYAEPINPHTQITRWPGTIDAECQAQLAEQCRWPFCPCQFPDRYPEGENE